MTVGSEILFDRDRNYDDRLAFFALPLLHPENFFVACFTFRRDYEDSARYAFSVLESGIEIYKMDGSLSRIIFPTIRRSISVVCETNYGLHRNKPRDHRSNVSILRYITNASGRGKFEVRHV